jgi:hypothetical protein
MLLRLTRGTSFALPHGMANPVPGRSTVHFRGLTFSGATHEHALATLAKRFPHYKSTPRKSDPIVRGWLDSSNHFTSDRSLSAHPSLYPNHSVPLPPIS